MRKKSNITELSVRELQTRVKGSSTRKVVKDSEIDYSDIPKFTDKELKKKFKRPGRPLVGEAPRKAISIRIDESVLDKIKKKARKEGIAYQSLINDILKRAV
ncbi:BrnA antitoxin family protein [Bdellovibrio sp. HCB2-146]|uniref:BrnA antitoxin family protein n=1 Tax=Bdellovibrio sp. HCB2-146 TaxID=3394362 RepID=UPI0039BD5980